MNQRLVKIKLNMPALLLILAVSCFFNITVATAKRTPLEVQLDTIFDCESFNTALAIIDAIEDTRVHVTAAIGFLTNRCGGQDQARGLQILHRIARMDFSIAQSHAHLFLGLAYLQGWGVRPDLKEARYWFQRATIRFAFSDSRVIEIIFRNTHQGHGMKSPPSLLLEEIKNVQAMRDASPEEHFKTYHALWSGQGLPMDRPSAERFLHRAVDRHLPQALYEYGRLILERKINMIHEPRKELIELALTSLAVAAASNYGPAQQRLGRYCRDEGTQPRHKIHAYVLFRRAYEGGLKEAGPEMAVLFQSLSAHELPVATKLLNDKRPILPCLHKQQGSVKDHSRSEGG